MPGADMGGHGVESTRSKHWSSENRLCPAEWINIKLRTAGQARPYIMAWVELHTPIGTDRTQSKDETVRALPDYGEACRTANRHWRLFGELPCVLIWLDGH